MSSQAVGPDGRTWVVRRRWVPRLGTETVWGRFRRRFRATARRVGDSADPGCGVDIGEGIVALILVVAFLLLLLFVVLPLLVAVLDLLLVVLLALVGVVARTLFGHPWVVEAVDGDGAALRWRVQGWRASRERVTEVTQLLAAGVTPPGAEHLAREPEPEG